MLLPLSTSWHLRTWEIKSIKFKFPASLISGTAQNCNAAQTFLHIDNFDSEQQLLPALV
jgi:hypothetical protein